MPMKHLMLNFDTRQSLPCTLARLQCSPQLSSRFVHAMYLHNPAAGLATAAAASGRVSS